MPSTKHSSYALLTPVARAIRSRRMLTKSEVPSVTFPICSDLKRDRREAKCSSRPRKMSTNKLSPLCAALWRRKAVEDNDSIEEPTDCHERAGEAPETLWRVESPYREPEIECGPLRTLRRAGEAKSIAISFQVATSMPGHLARKTGFRAFMTDKQTLGTFRISSVPCVERSFQDLCSTAK